MKGYSDRVGRLIKEISRLPGIGPKSAERIVLHILKTDDDYARSLSMLIKEVKDHSFFCEKCFYLSETTICHICEDPTRNTVQICVVEESKDVISLEKTGHYHGLYHVLHGALSPLSGIGPDDLKVGQLFNRVRALRTTEIILATNSNTEGETTALYLSKILKPLNVRTTRLAKGISVGSNIEYADQATLGQALDGRVTL